MRCLGKPVRRPAALMLEYSLTAHVSLSSWLYLAAQYRALPQFNVAQSSNSMKRTYLGLAGFLPNRPSRQ